MVVVCKVRNKEVLYWGVGRVGGVGVVVARELKQEKPGGTCDLTDAR